MKIAIIEDNKDISKLLKIYLEAEKYEVLQAYDGEEGAKIALNNNVDLVILDLMLPKKSGFEVLSEIRETSNVPVLIISAKSEIDDKLLGFNIGADDYLTKPFNSVEVIARVKALLRRSTTKSANKILKVADLTLDTEKWKLFKGEEEIFLTATEYKILFILMQSPQIVFSKTKLCETLNGVYFESDENSIVVHVSHLREKIGLDKNNLHYIKTVKGLGYKIEKN